MSSGPPNHLGRAPATVPGRAGASLHQRVGHVARPRDDQEFPKPVKFEEPHCGPSLPLRRAPDALSPAKVPQGEAKHRHLHAGERPKEVSGANARGHADVECAAFLLANPSELPGLTDQCLRWSAYECGAHAHFIADRRRSSGPRQPSYPSRRCTSASWPGRSAGRTPGQLRPRSAASPR